MVKLDPVTSVPHSSADDADLRIGSAIRERRQDLGLSVRDVAKAANVSVGMLSQMERGLTSPSLRTIREICRIIDLPMHRLFDGGAPEFEDGTIVRRNERRRLDLDGKRMTKELLTREGGGLQAMLVTIESGGGSGENPYSHDGEEVGVVLSGTVLLWVSGRRYVLQEGDSFKFQSREPHRFHNPGPAQATILWTVSEPFY